MRLGAMLLVSGCGNPDSGTATRNGGVLMLTRILLITIVLATPAYATDFYASPSGSDANSCTAAQSPSTPKQTLASVLTCESAGDTIFLADGTYDGGITSSQITAGTSTSNRTTIRAINKHGATITKTGGTQVVLLDNRPFLHFWGIVFDGTGASNNPMKLQNNSHHILLEHNRFTNSQTVGLLIQASPDGIARWNRFDHNGNSTLEHGVYNNAGSDRWLYEFNELDHNAQFGIQIYTTPDNVVFRYNYLHDNCQVGSGGAEMFVSHQGHTIERNLIVTDNSTGESCGVGINNDLQAPANNTFDHNTIVCVAGRCKTASGSTQGYGINIRSSSVQNATLRNNLIIGYAQGIRDAGTGTTLTDNNTTGTTGDHFTNAGAGDFSLKAGSAAINNATDLGGNFCGSNPDHGVFEVPTVVAASINGNTLDVTICNIAPPMQPNGTWTPACSGTDCGTPVVSGTPAVTGGGLVRLTLSGIGGTGACLNTQTWTISASGNTNTDSALIGNQWNQPLHTATNFPVDSSACDGSGGPTPPAGEAAHYEFEGNTNDSSGNANHAIGSANISYAASKTGQGVQFTSGVESYVDTGLLSGHNPSTDHLVVAFGIRVSELGVRRVVAGVPVGTDQRFYIRRDSDNVWDFSTQANGSPTNTEFPVVLGDTHVCVKFNPTTDQATLYINGQAGTISGASVQNYTSYTFPSTLRFGLPSGFPTSQSGNDIIGDARIHTTDVSCVDLYNAWNPEGTAPIPTQVAHQWQGVFQLSGSPEDRGAVNEQRKVMQGGSASLVVQLNNTSGAEATIQPRFRYNINGGAFNSVVPDTPTADGISMWGSAVTSGLNNGVAAGPLTGALTHTNGVRLFTSSAVPTIVMPNNTSYTLGGTFVIDTAIADPENPPVVCFKVYDQSGQPVPSYTPSEGACLTVIPTQAAGGF